MQCSGLQVGAFLVLLAGTILIAISIGTSSWSTVSGKASSQQLNLGNWASGGGEVERGLWQECYRVAGAVSSLKIEHDQCYNRYQAALDKIEQLRDGKEVYEALSKELQPWEVAVLALMCGSGLLGILSLLFTPCCCNRCGCCLASFVLFAAALSTSGVCTYAYYISTGQGNKDFSLDTKHFGWSFWCAVAGGASQFLAGVLFAVSRCRQHSYSHTI